MIQEACSWTIRIFGLLSFLSCICVACETLAEWKANKVVLRNQAWMQLPLSIMSLEYALAYSTESYWCQIQGFVFQVVVIGSLGMDLCLSLCYMFMLVCSWKETRLQQLVKCLHIIAWPAAILPAVYLLLNQRYGKIGNG